MKATKQEAAYVPAAARRQCKDCAHYRAGSCTEVTGAISPLASCKYFEKATAKAGKK